jgi:hypothetical protein
MKNHKYRILTIVICLNLVLACHNEKGWISRIKTPQEFINIFPQEFEINAEVFIDDTINLLNPFSVEILGNLLWVKNPGTSSNKLISVFDINSKDYLGDLLKKGNGPYEHNNSICHNISKDSLFVLEFYSKRASLFSVEKVRNLDDTPDRVINIKTKNLSENIYRTISFNNSFICSGEFAQGRFNTFSLNGYSLQMFGKYPDINFNDTISNYHLGNLFGSNLWFCSNLNNSRLAAINKYSLTLFDFNQKDESFTEYFNIQWWKPKIANAGSLKGRVFVLRNAAEEYLGAGTIITKDEYLLFPFSKFSVADVFKSGTENEYNYILVMNWEGTPVARFELDKSISSSLALDNEGNYLYSIHTDTHTGFKQIVRFNMNDIISKINLD